MHVEPALDTRSAVPQLRLYTLCKTEAKSIQVGVGHTRPWTYHMASQHEVRTQDVMCSYLNKGVLDCL